jgi:hypothetical protein
MGSFAGGIMMANFGTRTTFRILGAEAEIRICGAVYFLINRFYLAKIEKLQRKPTSCYSPYFLTPPPEVSSLGPSVDQSRAAAARTGKDPTTT